MAIKLRVLANADNVYLAWDPSQIDNCLGFAIHRKLKKPGSAAFTESVLNNRVGFTDAPAAGDREASASLAYRPKRSDQFPFQRFDWTDHGCELHDRVCYKIVAMVGSADALTAGQASEWSDELELSADCGSGMSVYFNKGIVLSQYIAHEMATHNWTPADLKVHAAELGSSLRKFLGGTLLKGLNELLDGLIDSPDRSVYAALFELTDDELIGKLKRLGSRLNIVLANGAVDHSRDDENATARAQLAAAGASVHDRMSAPRFLAHNKFLVICDENGNAQRVWTGSTNWQPTGLCTQVNNGILIDCVELAADYKNAWLRIQSAGDASSTALKEGNSADLVFRDVGKGVTAAARFTATRATVDINDLLRLIDGAKSSIFFEMFMPGAGIYQALLAKKDVPGMFLRGVVNTFPRAASTSQVDATLVTSEQKSVRDYTLDVIEPEGVANAFGKWAAEVTRRQFESIGHAIVHSKVLVIDADTESPIVVTGSHNFSNSASTKNDENFLVIRNSRQLAQAYLVNCLAVYEHYRWRAYIADSIHQGKTPWSHLDRSPDWLDKYAATPAHKTVQAFWRRWHS